MATGVISKHGFGEVQQVAFPFTATVDGIAIAVIVPPTSSTSYLYIFEDGNIHCRGCALNGTQYTVTFPVKKGRIYSVQSSSNVDYARGIRIYPIE